MSAKFIHRNMLPFTCPECNLLGMMDEEQQSGKVSIICPVCGWHGYNSSKQKTVSVKGRVLKDD